MSAPPGALRPRDLGAYFRWKRERRSPSLPLGYAIAKSASVRRRCEATAISKATIMRSVTRSLVAESLPRPAPSASDTDDEDEDKDDEDEEPRPYGIAREPL